MMQVLLAADGVMKLDVNADAKEITVCVDRSRVSPHGKKAIGELLLKIHIYHARPT